MVNIGDNERLCAKKHHMFTSYILTLAGFKPRDLVIQSQVLYGHEDALCPESANWSDRICSDRHSWQAVNSNKYICLFVLRFYGPVNPMGSYREVSLPNHTFTGQA